MKFDTLERKALVETLQKAYPASTSLWLEFEGCRIKVVCNDDTTIKALQEYFSPFLAPEGSPHILISVHEAAPPEFSRQFTEKTPDPGKVKIKEEYLDLPDGRIVRKRLTGMLFVFGGPDNVAVGPCRRNVNQVVNFINNRFIGWKLRQGCLLGHAAGVKLDNKGLGLAGFSGMGKSTLALCLMSKGATFVSNDRLLIKNSDAGLKMYGVAKLPRINPGTALNNPDLEGVVPEADRGRFAELDGDALWHLEHKYDVFIDRCFGPRRFELAAPMDALVILNWQRTDTPMTVKQVDPKSRTDLLPAFMKSTGLFFLAEKDDPPFDHSLEAYVRHLEKCKVFEISGGVDFDSACASCLEILTAA